MMAQRISIRATCAALCLLASVSLAPWPIAAQGCDDCRELKGLPVATPRSVSPTATTAPATTVVRLVLYWAEGCGHCHEVLDDLLPRLQQQYGSQLEVRLVEVVSLEDISAFFALAEAYGYSRGRASVPFLLIGDRALLGVEQIERELPGLVEAALTAGGAAWPAPPAQSVAGPAPAATDDACGFTTPCPEEVAAATPLADLPVRRSPLVLAAASVLGLALLVGGAASFWRWRYKAAACGLAHSLHRDTSPIGSEHVQPTERQNDAI